MFKLLFSGLIIGFVSSPTCPSNGEEIKHGTKYGFASSLLVGAGAVTGDAIVLAAILLWLMPFIGSDSIIVTFLWLFGSIVLFYVAWGIFKEIRTVQGVGEKRTMDLMNPVRHYFRAFWIGIAITTFNPFTVLWWMGLLTPIVNDGNSISMVYPLAVLFGALLWFVLLAILLHLGERWLNKKSRQAILLISGLAVLGYSIYFLIQFVNQIF
ncbi:Threonine/homoserine/homoserine lactone efflux protein [Halobacillus dabanensis]|uniref:Threonine/homoserine/homoserine lactone efflux protein n=1 Tax=Halobacillus dabanensis TaxID=240302 RepID=A0A1I3W8L1_HALDA|nr:LysE family transporter [Halobacillus dabanensis]SFK03782.1 Threonine/homoserine/homoserine lactone efflux protein [Halobacillus dabanensis]